MKLKRHKGFCQLLVLLVVEIISIWAIYLHGFSVTALP